MTTAHDGSPDPDVSFDGLPALRKSEVGLALLHPYAPVAPGRYITPGGGRLTLRKSGAHYRVRLDHLGCPAQLTEDKNRLFKSLALAAEGRCLHAGCRHRVAAYHGAPLRTFQVLPSAITPTAFVRALLATELGDERPTERLFAQTVKLAGPVRRATG